MNVDSIINWALHTGLDLSVLIAIILIFRRQVAKIFGAQVAYCLWALPFIRLAIPDISLTISRPNWMAPTPIFSSNNRIISEVELNALASVSSQVSWQIIGIGLWVFVAVIWLASQLWRQAKYVQLIRKTSTTATNDVLLKTSDAAKALHLNRHPHVRISTTNVGPLVAGVFRPIIILPRSFEKEFSDQQQFLALTHELAHIKRKDLWAAFAILIFRAFNWANPLVHLSASKFRIDQEAACDAYVLKIMGGGAHIKQSYVATLIHSAKLTQTPTGEARQSNPLCLTIYHPLKERLMTMKTPKNKSTLLSRTAAAAFLIAAVVATAPITIAAAQDNAPTPHVQTKVKKVMKLVENNNGVETKKTYEITIEDGVTTAHSIDEFGNKTVFDLAEIEGMEGLDDVNVFVMNNDDLSGERHIKILTEDHLGQEIGEGQGRVFVNRIKRGADGMDAEIDSDVYVMGQGSHASAMINAAQDLLSRAADPSSGEALSPKALRKVKKARKALLEAQEAMEAE